MSTRKYQKQNTITPDKVASYDLNLKGVTQVDIAKQMKVSTASVCRWIKDVTEYIKQSPEYQEALPTICKMIPKASAIYNKGLDEGLRPGLPITQLQMTLATNVYRMTALMIDHSRNENIDSKLNLTDDQLREEVKRLGQSDKALIDSMSKDGEHGRG